ncbi:MAG TPA: glycosyltransferase [Patescibacteria group bacterium]
MLHLVFLSPHSDPQATLGEPDSGGQCVYQHQLALALTQYPDLQVTTFCRQTYQRPAISQLNDRYRIVRLEIGDKEYVPKEIMERHIPEFAQKVHAYLKKNFPQEGAILHAHYWDGGRTALELKHLDSGRYGLIWTPHSLGALKRRKFVGEHMEAMYNFIPRVCWENYTALTARKVIVSSTIEKNDLMELYAVPARKIEVIAPGVDFSHLKMADRLTARRQLQLPESGNILLCLGRQVPSKGYHHAIKALRVVKEKLEEPVYLVIAGGSEQPSTPVEIQYRRQLTNLIKELNVQDNVVFFPAAPHDQVHYLFNAADIFLMPSEHEPFGIVTIESMAVRRPVVAANAGGPAEIITHNQTGCLVDFDQPVQAAKYILSLLKDSRFTQRIVNNAYHYVRQEYSWPARAEEFAHIYRQVAQGRRSNLFAHWTHNNYFLQQAFTPSPSSSPRHSQQNTKERKVCVSSKLPHWRNPFPQPSMVAPSWLSTT